METLKISYNLPNLNVAVVADIDGIILGMTANNLVANYPWLFWLEPDVEGNDHLCTHAILDSKIPAITHSLPAVVDKGKLFELVDIFGKTEGDRVRPRPPRP